MNSRSKVVFSAVLCAALATTACSAAPDASEPNASTSEDLTGARAPIPFGLQFVGAYADPRAAAGAVTQLEVHRNGTYTALIQGQARSERGAFVGAARPALPYVFRLISRGHSWTATVSAYDGALSIARGGHTGAVRALGKVGPDENLCDASHGVWSDDEPDAATGLYCVCAAPRVYIPSQGGCIR